MSKSMECFKLMLKCNRLMNGRSHLKDPTHFAHLSLFWGVNEEGNFSYSTKERGDTFAGAQVRGR